MYGFFDSGSVGSSVDEVEAVSGSNVFIRLWSEECDEWVVGMGRVPERALEPGQHEQGFFSEKEGRLDIPLSAPFDLSPKLPTLPCPIPM